MGSAFISAGSETQHCVVYERAPYTGKIETEFTGATESGQNERSFGRLGRGAVNILVPHLYLPAPKPNIVFHSSLHSLGFTLAVVTMSEHHWHRQRCSKDPWLSRSTQPAFCGMTGSTDVRQVG